jgi:tRNA splicing endonuclease
MSSKQSNVECIESLIALNKKLADKITELEKETPAPKGLWVTSKDLHVWQLEQQAKGVEDTLSSVERYYLVDRYWIDVADLRVKAIDLEDQAKALKEKGNE